MMESTFTTHQFVILLHYYLVFKVIAYDNLVTSNAICDFPSCNTIELKNGISIRLETKLVTGMTNEEARWPEVKRANNYVCKLPACLSAPCLNGASCVETFQGFICECSPGVYSEHCACLSNPCLNGGTCTETLQAYTCECTAAYEGQHCETPAAPPVASAPGVVPTPCPWSQSCPDSWSNYQSNCYQYIHTSVHFSPALSSCRASVQSNCEADLVSIHSIRELEFLKQICETTPSNCDSQWIGLSRTAYSDPFAWTDKTPLNYTEWQNGEPTSIGPGYFFSLFCVQMNMTSLEWVTTSCSEEVSSYTCKFSMNQES
ncbi:neurocan core protein-like [Lytechinus pictus]|uniref:neurocan core protein-like n=1 Tax=Lytechinus pictus TaxID=7653 RepID=UPI0030BA1B37